MSIGRDPKESNLLSFRAVETGTFNGALDDNETRFASGDASEISSIGSRKDCDSALWNMLLEVEVDSGSALGGRKASDWDIAN